MTQRSGCPQSVNPHELHIPYPPGDCSIASYASAEVDASEASPWGKALATRKQTLIEDIEQEPRDQPSFERAAAAGYRAVQSTPLVTSNNNKVVGMLSTNFREPHHFSAHDLRLIDICARQAADAINVHQLQRSLRDIERRLRELKP